MNDYKNQSISSFLRVYVVPKGMALSEAVSKGNWEKKHLQNKATPQQINPLFWAQQQISKFISPNGYFKNKYPNQIVLRFEFFKYEKRIDKDSGEVKYEPVFVKAYPQNPNHIIWEVNGKNYIVDINSSLNIQFNEAEPPRLYNPEKKSKAALAAEVKEFMSKAESAKLEILTNKLDDFFIKIAQNWKWFEAELGKAVKPEFTINSYTLNKNIVLVVPSERSSPQAIKFLQEIIEFLSGKKERKISAKYSKLIEECRIKEILIINPNPKTA